MINNISIEKELNGIFIRKFNISLNDVNEELFDKDLLGKEFFFEPIDLLLLYMEIEKLFRILIPQEYVAENKFNTINNIKEIVNAQLRKKEASNNDL